MKNTYFPEHRDNRMKSEGDVIAARKYFMAGKNRVLYHLIEQRFFWMNKYIRDTDETIIELGCGAGLSREFIKNKNLILTDVVKHEWVDRYMDALNIDYPDESIDVIICPHMLHHISNPAAFLENISKKLKKGGRILIQDIYTCTLMKIVLRIMRHEGWSDDLNIYDREAICNNPDDPWSANCSIPKLLFFSREWIKEFPMYKMLKRTRSECFLFLSSGGVIAKTFYLPVGDKGVWLIKKLDKILVRFAPFFFACGCSVVLQKKYDYEIN